MHEQDSVQAGNPSAKREAHLANFVGVAALDLGNIDRASQRLSKETLQHGQHCLNAARRRAGGSVAACTPRSTVWATMESEVRKF
jgi:hypothetical protein